MLDLSVVLNTKAYEVKLIDGKILHLKRPTQAIQEMLVKMEMLAKQNDNEKIFGIITSVFTRILNRNEDNIIFTEDKIKEEYDLALQMILLKDYFEYWNKDVSDNVNFQVSQ